MRAGGPAQTLAWGGGYYIPAILASPIARNLGAGGAVGAAGYGARTG